MHSNHRNRVRKKFLKYGIDSFEPHEIIEFLLFWSIPRKDTNVIAHDLINKFGSISAVFDASYKSLLEVDGIGENSATLLKLIPQLSRIYQESKFLVGKKTPTLEECYDKLVLKFIGRTDEAVAVMLFDSKGKIVFDGIVNKGSVNAVEIYSRKIVELISHYYATSIILAHNHPSGIALPSKSDILSTDKLNVILESMRVKFIDHIIVADNDYISMAQDRIGETFGGPNWDSYDQ